MTTNKILNFLFKIVVYDDEYLSRHNKKDSFEQFVFLVWNYKCVKNFPLPDDTVAQASLKSKYIIPQTCEAFLSAHLYCFQLDHFLRFRNISSFLLCYKRTLLFLGSLLLLFSHIPTLH